MMMMMESDVSGDLFLPRGIFSAPL